MSEKLYRIKPLVWSSDGIAKTFGAIYVTLIDGRVFDGALVIYESQDHAQRDYEQRLISAGVVEEVER